MSQRLPRLPFVLLGSMTLCTLTGPFLIGSVLKGGESPRWPPDRTVEWVVVLGLSGIVLGLMLACLSLALIKRPTVVRRSPEDSAGGPP